ncbi:MAG: hydroxymethylglutaryl-CoA lyase [Saprospiraceae bacterium]|nr:hydroxymethylglutaryl-CoA lyase [Saprospiraceae bacterium]
MLKIIECPRDAMQGLTDFIETEDKIKYINALLKVGYDTIDFGSFVSPKAIPQMRDTVEVLKNLNLQDTKSKLLAIVANRRGAEDAVSFPEIKYLGYPFSISETFQIRNTNATIEESLKRVGDIKKLCDDTGKELVIYISMGFGNPYGDDWDADIACHWTEKLIEMGIKIISLSDTIGVSNPASITYLFDKLVNRFADVEFGAHLHTQPFNWEEKVNAAYSAGCKRFDTAIRGFGGCPMAKDDLTGNMATENLLYYFLKNKVQTGLDDDKFQEALTIANEIFPDWQH